MKLFLSVVKYGEPLNYEIHRAWKTLKQAYVCCNMGANDKDQKTYYPKSAQIYFLDTNNLENDLELVYTTLEK